MINDIKPCESCSKLDGVKWLHGGKWRCLECMKAVCNPLPCSRCERLALVAGIERYMKLSAGYDTYNLEQSLGFRCEAGHITIGSRQWGPGAGEKAWKPVE